MYIFRKKILSRHCSGLLIVYWCSFCNIRNVHHGIIMIPKTVSPSSWQPVSVAHSKRRHFLSELQWLKKPALTRCENAWRERGTGPRVGRLTSSCPRLTSVGVWPSSPAPTPALARRRPGASLRGERRSSWPAGDRTEPGGPIIYLTGHFSF